MKVCFVSSYPPNRARLSEYAQNLVNALADRPSIDELYILADKSANSILKLNLSNASKVIVIRVWSVDGFLSILFVMFHILKLRPDVVHFNVAFQSFGKSKFTNFAGLSLIFLSRFLGFKVLAAVHTLAEKVDLEKVNLKQNVVNRTGILIATKLILSAQNVVVLVRSYAECLSQRYGHRGIQFIPHGATVEPFLKASNAEKTILLFGHMGPHKGLPIMLSAFKELRKKTANIKLVVAGSNHPNFPNYLANFVTEQVPGVSFLGYIPQENLGSVFRSADLVVLPYFVAPGTSGVFHLACSYGLPVVASDLPEIREMVNDGACAVLLPPGNVAALVDAIAAVLFDGEKASKMSAQNLKFAQKESWSAVAEAYENMYLHLAGNKSSVFS